MRRVLLDTHLLLWATAKSRRLPKQARLLLEDPTHEVFFSVASLWEITIKSQLGKLELGVPLGEFFRNSVERRELTLQTAFEADEAFLTSTTRGVVPIVELDDAPIGSGDVGPVTADLIERYRRALSELR